MRSRVLLFVFLTVFLDMIGFRCRHPALPFTCARWAGSAEIVGVLLGSFSLTAGGSDADSRPPLRPLRGGDG